MPILINRDKSLIKIITFFLKIYIKKLNIVPCKRKPKEPEIKITNFDNFVNISKKFQTIDLSLVVKLQPCLNR